MSLWQMCKLKSSDTLLVQCPQELLTPILLIKKLRKFKLVYLIHDIYCIKFTGEYIKEHEAEIKRAIKLIEQCDEVIAHNDIMISKMRTIGFKCKFHNLEIFDYYTESMPSKREYANDTKFTLVFAGSLSRNPFIQKLDSIPHNYNINFYGMPAVTLKNFTYKGSVDAGVLPEVLEGQFGLLWADDYEQEKDNNYMMYNNPHKMSLYIVSGIPIITWSGYAAAKYINNHGIGICIDRLDQLDEVLANISKEEYDKMVKNCLAIRKKLINGDNLVRVMSECLS